MTTLRSPASAPAREKSTHPEKEGQWLTLESYVRYVLKMEGRVWK